MKNRLTIWHLGYAICIILFLIVLCTNVSKDIKAAFTTLISIIFTVCYLQIYHNKMMKVDKSYKINVLDERNIAIKDKMAHTSYCIMMIMCALATIYFIMMNMILPAVILGVIIFVQPFIMIIVSTVMERKM